MNMHGISLLGNVKNLKLRARNFAWRRNRFNGWKIQATCFKMVYETILYRSCRICNVSTLDGDFVDLFQKEEGFVMTATGLLYKELMGLEVLPTEPVYYPNCVCSSCDLQMKLFKSLKERALKTLKTFESYSSAIELNGVDSKTTNSTEDMQQENELFKIIVAVGESSSCNGYEMFGKQETPQLPSDAEHIEDQNLEADTNLLIVYESEGDDMPDQSKNASTDDTVSELYANLNGTNIVKTDAAFKCKECGCDLPSLRLLRMHRKQNHPLVHRCTECCKTLRSAESLEVHMKQHLGLPAYSCEECDRTFKQKVHYQYHMKRHNNERNFNCEECGKGYVSKSDLNTHMRQHSNERPYTCSVEYCDKQFYTEQHLKTHMYHHNEVKSFECDICHGKFISPTVLHTHRQSIHFERRFECVVCGKKFRRKHHLELHTITHENNLFKNNDTHFEENGYCNLENDIETDLPENHETCSDSEFLRDAIESCAESESENGFA